MKYKKLLIVIISMVIFSIIFFIKNNYNFSKKGNNIINKSADEIKEYILNIESYEATASVSIKSNKNENKYIIYQKYIKEGNIYLQRVLEPKNIAGVEFEYDGENLIVRNVRFNLTKIYKEYKFIESSELCLIKFIEDYNNDKNSRYYEEGKKLILETKIKNSNKYISNKKLYINKEEGKIEKLEIQDIAQNTKIYILYNEIEINKPSKDEILAFYKGQ